MIVKKKIIMLVGFGTIGKRYFNIIKKKNFEIIVIRKSNKKLIYKKKNICFKYRDISKITLKNISLVIIASPLETHWKYLKFFLNKKIDILIEKPVIENKSQFFKLERLIKKFDNNFYINHTDLYNKNFLSLVKKINTKKIHKIIFYYGNNKNNYKNDKKKFPFTDWLPHMLSIIIYLSKKISFYKIFYFRREIIDNQVYEKILVKFYSKYSESEVFFSNFPGIKSRTFKIESKNFFLNFDGLKNNNYLVTARNKFSVNHNSKRTFNNLIDIALSNFNKKIHNDFYLFKRYFMIWHKINIELSKF
jgi:predicted dehydrogenase